MVGRRSSEALLGRLGQDVLQGQEQFPLSGHIAQCCSVSDYTWHVCYIAACTTKAGPDLDLWVVLHPRLHDLGGAEGVPAVDQVHHAGIFGEEVGLQALASITAGRASAVPCMPDSPQAKTGLRAFH